MTRWHWLTFETRVELVGNCSSRLNIFWNCSNTMAHRWEPTHSRQTECVSRSEPLWHEGIKTKGMLFPSLFVTSTCLLQGSTSVVDSHMPISRRKLVRNWRSISWKGIDAYLLLLCLLPRVLIKIWDKGHLHTNCFVLAKPAMVFWIPTPSTRKPSWLLYLFNLLDTVGTEAGASRSGRVSSFRLEVRIGDYVKDFSEGYKINNSFSCLRQEKHLSE